MSLHKVWRQWMITEEVGMQFSALHGLNSTESRTEFSSGISRANCNFLCIEILG